MYDVLDDAIYYASQASRDLTANQKEAITAIYQKPDGTFAFATPQTSNQSDKVKASIKYPKGAKLVALVHNHPEFGGPEMQHQFSPEDLEMANGLNLMSVITYGPDMQIRMYKPGDKTQSSGGRVEMKSKQHALGTMFSHIPEVKVTAQRIGQLPPSMLNLANLVK